MSPKPNVQDYPISRFGCGVPSTALHYEEHKPHLLLGWDCISENFNGQRSTQPFLLFVVARAPFVPHILDIYKGGFWNCRKPLYRPRLHWNNWYPPVLPSVFQLRQCSGFLDQSSSSDVIIITHVTMSQSLALAVTCDRWGKWFVSQEDDPL